MARVIVDERDSSFDFALWLIRLIRIVGWIAFGIITFHILIGMGIAIVPAVIGGIIGGVITTWIVGKLGVLLHIIGL